MEKLILSVMLYVISLSLHAGEVCKMKQYRDGELVARESVFVVDRGNSFSVRTSQADFNSPLLIDGLATDSDGVEYRHGTIESGKLWITLPWLHMSLHIDCN